MQNKSIPSSSKSAQEATQGKSAPTQEAKDPQSAREPHEQPPISINIVETQPKQQSGKKEADSQVADVLEQGEIPQSNPVP